MEDVEIRFSREGLEGIVPVGTYLADAMRRMGVAIDEPSDLATNTHHCVVTVTEGAELLSPLTSLEIKFFEEEGSKPSRRLACQAKLERAGEMEVMTEEKKAEEKTPEAESDEYR